MKKKKERKKERKKEKEKGKTKHSRTLRDAPSDAFEARAEPVARRCRDLTALLLLFFTPREHDIDLSFVDTDRTEDPLRDKTNCRRSAVAVRDVVVNDRPRCLVYAPARFIPPERRIKLG